MDKDIKFDLNDISLQPCGYEFSTINSRDEVNIKENGFYKIFAAPMDKLTSYDNITEFHKRNINVCLPRLKEISDEQINSSNINSFVSLSLDQFKEKIIDSDILDHNKIHYLLIDVANGHMSSILDNTIKAKSKYSNLKLMVGNIANSQAFRRYCEAGVDYVRCGIGYGGYCSTSINSAINSPISLIRECKIIKDELKSDTKIILDGGIKINSGYRELVLPYFLGADYIMCGSMFSKSTLVNPLDKYFTTSKNQRIYSTENADKIIDSGGVELYKSFRGMSTLGAQSNIKTGGKIRASEGFEIEKVKVEYKIDDLIFHYDSYLKSSLSYCGYNNIEDAINKGFDNNVIFITNNAYNRFNLKQY